MYVCMYVCMYKGIREYALNYRALNIMMNKLDSFIAGYWVLRAPPRIQRQVNSVACLYGVRFCGKTKGEACINKLFKQVWWCRLGA